MIIRPNRDLDTLHPVCRQRVERVLEALHAGHTGLRLFETGRHPVRQAELYRTHRDENTGARIPDPKRPGKMLPVVTYSLPWDGRHQYGFAADFAAWDNGWKWPPKSDPIWAELHRIGERNGLRPKEFEAPHLEFADITVADLKAGRLPEHGRLPGFDRWLHWIEDCAAPGPPVGVPAWAWQFPPAWLTRDRPAEDGPDS